MQHKLKQLRAENNITQKEMANILGISRETYSLKESSKFEFGQDEMFALSNYFNLEMEYIFLPRGNQIGDSKANKVKGAS